MSNTSITTKPISRDKQVIILGHELSFCGFRINYLEDGCVKEFIAEEPGAVWMLIYVGYIKSSRWKRKDRMVKVELTDEQTVCGNVYNEVVGVVDMTWDYFTRKYALDDEWCKELVRYRKLHDSMFND